MTSNSRTIATDVVRDMKIEEQENALVFVFDTYKIWRVSQLEEVQFAFGVT